MSLRTWLIKFSTTNEVWDDHCSNLTGMLKFKETKIPGVTTGKRQWLGLNPGFLFLGSVKSLLWKFKNIYGLP